jgi:hypothetical protein
MASFKFYIEFGVIKGDLSLFQMLILFHCSWFPGAWRIFHGSTKNMKQPAKRYRINFALGHGPFIKKMHYFMCCSLIAVHKILHVYKLEQNFHIHVDNSGWLYFQTQQSGQPIYEMNYKPRSFISH